MRNDLRYEISMKGCHDMSCEKWLTLWKDDISMKGFHDMSCEKWLKISMKGHDMSCEKWLTLWD